MTNKSSGFGSVLKKLEQGSKGGGPNVTKYLDDGESIVVRVLDASNTAFPYRAHSDHTTKIPPHTCHQEKGEKEDLYDKAAKVLIDEAVSHLDPKIKNFDDQSEEAKENYKRVRKESNRFEAKNRVKFGFINLKDGQPVIIDLAEKFAKQLILGFEKHEDKIDRNAFEITKTGVEANTTYGLERVLLDELSEEQKKHWDASEGKTFDKSLIDNTHFYRDEEQQLKDLVTMGFDVSRINLEAPEGVTAAPQEDVQQEVTQEAETVSVEESDVAAEEAMRAVEEFQMENDAESEPA
ncbi:hypothetical protein IMZ31_19595 (plasmid) [Pontibacillus sp. ALD_SL1]|uniref:hypothetical protein n=1 Tax=Pontibacillus sp. ALD_SL1 TaxID=2777185 RepID=UPI001A96564F|nr:hypothetical protein [Pontibacillus sp. ALD_SL1]QST02756.1 hypothetical protein IMZ31_19595 [Pontibacillus sp. ALD_SL1]